MRNSPHLKVKEAYKPPADKPKEIHTKTIMTKLVRIKNKEKIESSRREIIPYLQESNSMTASLSSETMGA